MLGMQEPTVALVIAATAEPSTASGSFGVDAEGVRDGGLILQVGGSVVHRRKEVGASLSKQDAPRLFSLVQFSLSRIATPLASLI